MRAQSRDEYTEIVVPSPSELINGVATRHLSAARGEIAATSRDGERERSETLGVRTVSLCLTVLSVVLHKISCPSQLLEQRVRPSELSERDRTGAEWLSST